MDLQQLQYFITCSEKGSLTRAAEELYTTQPHVSQVITALERELGMKLFRRTGSGVVPTEGGERIRLYALNALKNAALIQEISREGRREELRIAANHSSWLAFTAGDYMFRCREEGVHLQYTECGIEEMMDLLEPRQYDLGFLFLPDNRLPAFTHMAERKHLAFTKLMQSDLVVYCGEKGPFFGRDRLRAEELNGCACVQSEDDFFSLDELLLEIPGFRMGRDSIEKRVRTNSDHLMLRLLRETELCNIGSYWMRRTARDSAFSMSRVEGFEGRVSFGFLHPQGKELSGAAEQFLGLMASSQ
jgi:DNA-binding transcriptional LysR family regulator